MADSATSKTPATPMTLEEARDEVKKCDQEIQSIKAALRGIGTADGSLSESNSLEIEFTKVRAMVCFALRFGVFDLSSAAL